MLPKGPYAQIKPGWESGILFSAPIHAGFSEDDGRAGEAAKRRIRTHKDRYATFWINF
jgi:hypothetical protein